MTDLNLVARLAKKAATHTGRDINVHRDWAEAFAALLADECAKIAENTFEGGCSGQDGDSGYDFMGENSAAAIRARFVHSPKPLT
jgi:hypothetical protein